MRLQPEYGTRITHVALRTEDGVVHKMEAPNRHYHVIDMMGQAGVSREDIARADQGFVTDTGFWMRREPAMRFALEVGQITKHAHPRQLFSEDLW